MSEFSYKMDKLRFKMITRLISKASCTDTSNSRLTYMDDVIFEAVIPEINIEFIKDLYDMYDAKTPRKQAISTLNSAYPNTQTA